MRITSENLDDICTRNEQIKGQVNEHIQFVEKRLIKWRSLPIEEQALIILKEYNLIQIPIPEENWGGAIRTFPNGKRVPIINTTQPRLNQYYIYWRLIYDLTLNEEIDHHDLEEIVISTDYNLNKRKADYFANKMIFGFYDLYDYFISFNEEDFISKISCCMKSFKAPYKAVLIELYLTAKIYHNDILQEDIKSNFDRKFSMLEWSTIFQKYALDDFLVKPSLAINMNPIIHAIKDRIRLHPDVDLFVDNLEVVTECEKSFKTIQKSLDEGIKQFPNNP